MHDMSARLSLGTHDGRNRREILTEATTCFRSQQTSLSPLLRREISGDHSGGETPVPIPNTAVKPTSADGTALATGWKSRSLPGISLFVLPSQLPFSIAGTMAALTGSCRSCAPQDTRPSRCFVCVATASHSSQVSGVPHHTAAVMAPSSDQVLFRVSWGRLLSDV